MRPPLPLFPVSAAGSWPRSRELLHAQCGLQAGELPRPAFLALAREEVRHWVELQESMGVDLVTDGELTRADVRDLASTGRLRRHEPLAAEDARFLRSVTRKPLKLTLPGPYNLTRALWPELAPGAYGSQEELAEDAVALLQAEVAELCGLGVAMIQLDEPGLTELVSAQDPAAELDFAVGLINRVTDLIHELSAARSALHVGRGNWSPRGETVLGGGYRPLEPVFQRIRVSQLVLDYAASRAGDLLAFGRKELGLGVVNPRTSSVESPAEILLRVEEALELMPADKLFLNPDGGFDTLSERPMNGAAVAEAKLRAIVEVARELRRRVV